MVEVTTELVLLRLDLPYGSPPRFHRRRGSGRSQEDPRRDRFVGELDKIEEGLPDLHIAWCAWRIRDLAGSLRRGSFTKAFRWAPTCCMSVTKRAITARRSSSTARTSLSYTNAPSTYLYLLRIPAPGSRSAGLCSLRWTRKSAGGGAGGSRQALPRGSLRTGRFCRRDGDGLRGARDGGGDGARTGVGMRKGIGDWLGETGGGTTGGG